MNIYRRMMEGFYGGVAFSPEDGTGGGAPAGGDATAGGDAAPPAASTTLGGDAPAGDPIVPPAGNDEAGKVPETDEERTARLAAETPEQKAAREAEELKNETPEAKAAREAEEAKHAPKDGKYEPFTLADGFSMDDETQTEFTAWAKENDMNQAAAQSAIEMYQKQQAKQNQAWFDQVDTWRKTAATDPEIGGKDRGEKVATMLKARDAFGKDPALVELMETAGFGDNPALQRFMYRVGKMMSPGKTEGGIPVAEKKSLGERLYGAST